MIRGVSIFSNKITDQIKSQKGNLTYSFVLQIPNYHESLIAVILVTIGSDN